MENCAKEWQHLPKIHNFTKYLRKNVLILPHLYDPTFIPLCFYFQETNGQQYFCDIDFDRSKNILEIVTRRRDEVTGYYHRDRNFQKWQENPEFPNDIMLSIVTVFYRIMTQDQRLFGEFSGGTPYVDAVNEYKQLQLPLIDDA